jgi:hypothetical protein
MLSSTLARPVSFPEAPSVPLAKAHFTRVLARYEALLGDRSFEKLDRELFEETWSPSPGLLLQEELETVGPLIVEFELAVADRDARRATRALERAWAWVRQRGS